MRLAFYLAHYPSLGGTTTAVRGLTQALARAGHDVVILCQGPADRSWSEGPVTVRRFSRHVLPAPVFISRRLVDHVVAARPPWDLIVLNGMFHRDLPALARVAAKARIPYVVAPHDPYHPALFRQRRIWKEVYWRLVERPMLRRAAAIQLLAGAHGRHLASRGVERPPIEAPNGIDPSDLTGQPPVTRDNSAVTVGALGRMDMWNKGLDLLVRALALVRAEGADLQLIIQGRIQTDRAEVSRLAEALGIAEAVHLRGSTDDPISTIRGWDVLAIASRFEGFGLTAVEAMVAGTPILCSAEAGVAEHVRRGRCGVVAVPSVEGLAAGLRQLLARRAEWEQMATNGRAYAARELRWDAVASTVASHYQMLVDQRG